ncbi:MAG: hypothetical protein J6Q78_02720 [Clostridia bacterium]|nr:hypothetical protein [Clostridia bacterium]
MIKLTVEKNGYQADVKFPCTEKEMRESLVKIRAADLIPNKLYIKAVKEPLCMAGLAGKEIDLDEINYLAKLMDSFGTREEEKYYAAVGYEKTNNPKDLINLAFNIGQAYTLIQDIGNMENIGKTHYMALHGGVLPNARINEDFAEIGRKLIFSGKGTMTDYGLLFRNEEIEIEEVYKGQVFPYYSFDGDEAAVVAIGNDNIKEYVFLPCEDIAIEKAYARLGGDSDSYACVFAGFSFENREWQPKLEALLKQDGIFDMNALLKHVNQYDFDFDQLSTVVEYAGVVSTLDIASLAAHLDYFEIIDVYDDEALGKHLVENDSEYYASELVKEHIDYEALGKGFAENIDGEFTSQGFIYISNDLTLDDILGNDDGISHQSM